MKATEALFGMQRFGIEPGLDRVRALLARLGDPQDAFDAVLIAGTNGKGSTAAHLAAMLAQGDRRVGRFTSPHLVQPGERIVIGGEEMTAYDFEQQAERILPDAQAVGATFFEIVTALACRAFAEADVDVAVMEVGMGGRWDATNCLEPVACGIASIGLDHQAILGNSIAEIAREKAGILRAGVPAWSTARGEAANVLKSEAASTGTALRFLDRDADAELEVRSLGWRGSEMLLKQPGFADLPMRTPLLGRHQADNAGLAALLALTLGATTDEVAGGAAMTRWPGRLEVLSWRGMRVLLDGAHNPAASAALAGTLQRLGVRGVGVLGISEDKDVASTLAPLRPHLTGVHATRAKWSPRALAPDRLADQARIQGLAVFGEHEDTAAALDAAVRDAEARQADLVLVAGSLFLVGEVRARLVGEETPDLERWQ